MNRAALELDDKGTRYDAVRTSVRPEAGTFTTEYIKARPEIQLAKWGREVGCTIRYPGVRGSLAIVNGIVQWSDGDQAVHAYPLLPDADNDDGGVEMEILLGSKPPSNRFPFMIDGAEDLEFYPQPDVEIPPEFPNMRVPEHARGSIAVYHKNKRDHIRGRTNYGTGKAFHIYRPKGIDALGVEQWGTLEYGSGVLTVVMPPRFLERATYPVRIDPTFGHTGNGNSTGSFNPSELVGAVGTVGAADGDVDSIEARCGQNGSTLFKGVLLTSDGSAIVTNGVTPQTAVPSPIDWAQAVYSTKPAVTASTNYVCCIIGNAYVLSVRNDTGPANSGFYGTNGTFTTPVAGGSLGTQRYSVFANYTEAGGAAASLLRRRDPMAHMLVR